MAGDYKYKRVLLKLSGEALAGDLGYGIDPKVVDDLAEQIGEVVHDGVQIAIVVGGGNIFRGVSGATEGMDRAQADYIGMLATVMNALALQDSFERHGVYSRVQSAINMQEVSEPYIRRRAVRHLEKGRVVILAAGTGNPVLHHRYHRSSACMRAGRGLPDEGHQGRRRLRQRPRKKPRCEAFRQASPTWRCLNRGLHVMDSTATSLCMDNDMPMIVFDLTQKGNIARALKGEPVGTTVE